MLNATPNTSVPLSVVATAGSCLVMDSTAGADWEGGLTLIVGETECSTPPGEIVFTSVVLAVIVM